MKRSAAVLEALEEVKEKNKKEQKQKVKSINYNEKNKNEAVAHILPSMEHLKQLMYTLEQKWNARHLIEIQGDVLEETANPFLLAVAKTHDPMTYMGAMKKEDYWSGRKHPSAEEYLKRGIMDGPVDGRGNKDSYFEVFVTGEIRLTKEQMERTTEFEKDILHWCSQSNPKHFFYYWYRRKHFDTEADEDAYEDEEAEFLKKEKEAEEDEKELKSWVEMASLLKELQIKSGPAPQKMKDELAALQGENENTLETMKFKRSQVHGELEHDHANKTGFFQKKKNSKE